MKIKEVREEKHLTQEDVAHVIGTSTVNYSKKEAGSVRFSLEEARKLSVFFKLSIEELFFAKWVSKNET